MFEQGFPVLGIVIALIAFGVMNLLFLRWMIASAIVKGLHQYERERNQHDPEDSIDCGDHDEDGRIEPTFSR